MQCSVFNLPFQIAIYTRVITATMLLFLQFNFVVILRWYGIKKNEYHKFGIKHVVNPLTLNCLNFPHCLHLTFHAGLRVLGSNNFRNSSHKEKTAGSARVSKLSFRFL